MPKEPCGCKIGLKEMAVIIGMCVTVGGIMMAVGAYRQKVDQNTEISMVNVPQLERDMVVVKEQGKYITQKVDEISETVAVLAAQQCKTTRISKNKKAREEGVIGN